MAEETIPVSAAEREGLSANRQDPFVNLLSRFIRQAVRILALLMVLVILWGISDVVWVLYRQLIQPPFLLLNISDILATFGAFMAVLIAIEIFINITVYLSKSGIAMGRAFALPISKCSSMQIFDPADRLYIEDPSPGTAGSWTGWHVASLN